MMFVPTDSIQIQCIKCVSLVHTTASPVTKMVLAWAVIRTTIENYLLLLVDVCPWLAFTIMVLQFVSNVQATAACVLTIQSVVVVCQAFTWVSEVHVRVSAKQVLFLLLTLAEKLPVINVPMIAKTAILMAFVLPARNLWIARWMRILRGVFLVLVSMKMSTWNAYHVLLAVENVSMLVSALAALLVSFFTWIDALRCALLELTSMIGPLLV